jgi:hypothetical protein
MKNRKIYYKGIWMDEFPSLKVMKLFNKIIKKYFKNKL